MKLATVGSRNFKNQSKIMDFVENLPVCTIVVSGGAKGPDTIAEQSARARNMKTIVFRADWEKYGKSAGYIRNHLIVTEADELVAFWDGESKGTKHSIDLALAKKIPVRIIF